MGGPSLLHLYQHALSVCPHLVSDRPDRLSRGTLHGHAVRHASPRGPVAVHRLLCRPVRPPVYHGHCRRSHRHRLPVPCAGGSGRDAVHRSHSSGTGPQERGQRLSQPMYSGGHASAGAARRLIQMRRLVPGDSDRIHAPLSGGGRSPVRFGRPGKPPPLRRSPAGHGGPLLSWLWPPPASPSCVWEIPAAGSASGGTPGRASPSSAPSDGCGNFASSAPFFLWPFFRCPLSFPS